MRFAECYYNWDYILKSAHGVQRGMRTSSSTDNVSVRAKQGRCFYEQSTSTSHMKFREVRESLQALVSPLSPVLSINGG